MYHLFVDADFLPLYRISLAVGREFKMNTSTDRTQDFDKPLFL